MRIALLTPEFPTEEPHSSGLGTYLARLARALHSLGHEPEVFTLTAGARNTTSFLGVRVERIPAHTDSRIAWAAGRLSLPRTARAIAGALALAEALAERDRREPFDLVQCSDYGMTALAVARRAGRVLVTRCCWSPEVWLGASGTFDWDAAISAWLERVSLRRSDRTYAPSRFLARHLATRYGLSVGVVRPPFFLEHAADAEAPRVSARYLVHFGHLCRLKGTDLVARALLHAWEQEPHLRMIWAGPEAEPHILDDSRRLWGERSSQVVYLGRLGKPELYAVLRSAVASVLPSRWDNVPNTALESLALRVPVIAWADASLDEVVEPGLTGELVRGSNPRNLAAAMVRAWRGQVVFHRVGPALDAFNPSTAVDTLLRFAGFPPRRTGRRFVLTTPPLVLEALHPTSTLQGQAFNPQVEDVAAISVTCRYATPWTRIVFGSQSLTTTYGNAETLSAEVPQELYSRPGLVSLSLEDGGRRSNALPFVVAPSNGYVSAAADADQRALIRRSRVFYGFPPSAFRDDCVKGGEAKLHRLRQWFPDHSVDFSVVYLNSSSLPGCWQHLFRTARRSGAALVWNQDGVGYPGWYGPGWQDHNVPLALGNALADHVFYQSRFSKDSADMYLGPRDGPWEILYNAVDTSHFSPRAQARHRRDVVLLLGGNQHQYYRVESAVETLMSLRRQGSDARLLIAGALAFAASPDEAHQALASLLARTGAAEFVRVTGPYGQKDAPEIYRQADVLLHTKVKDPCPSVVIEALACGLPVVYCDSGGVPELVGADAGIGVPTPYDGWDADVPAPAEHLARGVQDVMDSYQERREAARQRAIERFDIEPWIRRHAEVFATVRPSERSEASSIAASGSPGLVRLYPDAIEEGEGFNVQANAESALAVECVNASPASYIVFDEKPLPTDYGGPGWLSALIPAVLLTAGTHDVSIVNGLAESTRAVLRVRPVVMDQGFENVRAGMDGSSR